MFEIFRDQNFELINENFSNKPLKKKSKIIKLKTEEEEFSMNIKNNEENVLSLLKELSAEEKELVVEKNQLLNIEETLKKRIIDEIETKKSRIIDLQLEIPELKQKLELLAKLLEIPVIK